MAATDEAYQEAVAFLQKTNLDGESVYEQLAKVVGAWPRIALEPDFKTIRDVSHPSSVSRRAVLAERLTPPSRSPSRTLR